MGQAQCNHRQGTVAQVKRTRNGEKNGKLLIIKENHRKTELHGAHA